MGRVSAPIVSTGYTVSAGFAASLVPAPGRSRGSPSGCEKMLLAGDGVQPLISKLLKSASERLLLKGKGLAHAIKPARASTPDVTFQTVKFPQSLSLAECVVTLLSEPFTPRFFLLSKVRHPA